MHDICTMQLSTITNKRGGGMKRSHCYISRAHKNKFREIKSTSKNWIIFAISKSSKREREKRSYNIPMFLCSSTCWKTRNDDDNYIGNAVCNGYREGKKKRKEKKRKEERNWIIRGFVRYKGSSTPATVYLHGQLYHCFSFSPPLPLVTI